MKRILRTFAIEALGLYLAYNIAQGLVFEKGIQSFLIASVALAAATLLIKPIINLLLLPFNIVTFGIFRWISHAITFYLVDLVLTEFEVVGFNFTGVDLIYIKLPAFSFPKGILAYIIFALILSIITTIVRWLRK